MADRVTDEQEYGWALIYEAARNYIAKLEARIRELEQRLEIEEQG